LNVVEAFNGANSVIYYGKGGEIASNHKEEQEMSVLGCGSCRPHWST
jgi:TnpA family transposase